MPGQQKKILSKSVSAVDPDKINPDLDNERRKCAFDVEDWARWWNGGEQKLLEKRDRGE